MSDHLKYPTKGHGAIPSFNSYEEEAEWWDTHDTGEDEIQAEFHPVTVRFSKPLSESASAYSKQLSGRLKLPI